MSRLSNVYAGCALLSFATAVLALLGVGPYLGRFDIPMFTALGVVGLSAWLSSQ